MRSRKKRRSKAEPAEAAVALPTVGLLLLLFALGGSSSRASASFLALSILSVPLLGWALFRPQRAAIRIDSFLIGWGLGGAALILLHLLPLPHGLWAGLPGREALLPGYKLSGVEPGWRPLSLDPQATLSSLLWLVAPAAAIALAMRRRALPEMEAGLAVIGLTVASLLLGFLQVSGPGNSALYFHQFTNWGLAVGLFANANHLGTLLLIAIPVFAALLVRLQPGRGRRTVRIAATVGFAVICLAGIYLTESIAALLLFPGALLLGVAIAVEAGERAGRWLGLAVHPLAFLALAGAAYGLASHPLVRKVESQSEERAVLARHAADALIAYWPVGSGLGSFVPVYASFQDSAKPGDRFANHAHNDYLELVLEAGLPGLLLILSLTGWWAMRSLRVWDRSDPAAPWPRAASAAIGLMLCHSVVDYPLRTPALAMIFALQLLVLGQKGAPPREQFGEEARPSRHLTFDSDELRFR